MKAWGLMYSKKVLDDAKTIFENVKITQNEGAEIIGEIENFEVTACLEFNSPSYPSCNCPQKTPCKHEASLMYYLEKHPELCIESEVTSIDKYYYKGKLSRVFKQGMGKDYEFHEIYDLDLMKHSLNQFLDEDIYHILLAGEYDFVCDLLCEIGDLLDDELMSSYDSWYDLSDSFMFYVHILSWSIYIDSDKMSELNSKTGLITDLITIF